MFRFISIILFICSFSTVWSDEEVELFKKHNTSDSSPAIECAFYTYKDIHSNANLQALKKIDPEHNIAVFWFQGFPVDKEINFEIKRLIQHDPDAYNRKNSFTLQSDGTLTDQNGKKDLFCLTSKGFLPGERVFCRFRTEDGTFDQETSFIPQPIVVKKGDDKIIEVEMIAPFPAVYEFKFTCFSNNEPYFFKSVTGWAITQEKKKYSSQKPLVFSPDIKGKKGGISTIEIRKLSEGKKYKIALPWGVNFMEYIFDGKRYTGQTA